MGKNLELDGYFFKNGKVGDVFYTHKTNKHIGAIATAHDVKVKTEKIVALESIGKDIPIAYRITKVTIINKND